jgi:hypothetical protein
VNSILTACPTCICCLSAILNEIEVYFEVEDLGMSGRLIFGVTFIEAIRETTLPFNGSRQTIGGQRLPSRLAHSPD